MKSQLSAEAEALRHAALDAVSAKPPGRSRIAGTHAAARSFQGSVGAGRILAPRNGAAGITKETGTWHEASTRSFFIINLCLYLSATGLK